MRLFARFASMAALLTAIGCSPSGDEPAQGPGSDQGTPDEVADDGSVDPGTGLIRADGWRLVSANCNGCHSTRNFLRMRGTKSTWNSAITWMQKTQGLWPLDPEVRSKIVDYLATHYGPSRSSRRAPIPLALMPPNPYSTPARKQAAERSQSGAVRSPR